MRGDLRQEGGRAKCFAFPYAVMPCHGACAFFPAPRAQSASVHILVPEVFDITVPLIAVMRPAVGSFEVYLGMEHEDKHPKRRAAES